MNRKLSVNKWKKQELSVFLTGDLKNILRDPLMLLVLLVPVFMVLLVEFGLALVDGQLASFGDFRLLNHRLFIIAVILLMTPLMIGMVTGFLLLDEMDDGIFSYMEITPLKKWGYLFYRVTLPSVIGFAVSLLMAGIFFAGEPVRWGALSLSLALISFIGPLITMYLAAFAKNKVEGMAYSKLISLLLLAPILSYLFDSRWTMAAYAIPVTWGAEAIYVAAAGKMSAYGMIGHWPILFAGGIIVTFLWLALFYHKLKQTI
ncbi:fluoroquinolone transport system permease protein [Evansella caseinilytica]|uniref:Fluoroquinolone transport system permease protein n=1 Tax=Evansella caseinilytica TaxID=1503961 RepID=A0A1H3QTS8_9BACI|nr:hypothetical protein [Evansella caseinilytica]SDZ16461.1 fluoroquinolone transport system permease protein [Evansella caseinilytica]